MVGGLDERLLLKVRTTFNKKKKYKIKKNKIIENKIYRFRAYHDI